MAGHIARPFYNLNFKKVMSDENDNYKETKPQWQDRPFLVGIDDAIRPVVEKFIGLKESEIPAENTRALMVIGVDAITIEDNEHYKNLAAVTGNVSAMVECVTRLLEVDPLFEEIFTAAFSRYQFNKFMAGKFAKKSGNDIVN